MVSETFFFSIYFSRIRTDEAMLVAVEIMLPLPLFLPQANLLYKNVECFNHTREIAQLKS